jgi:general secretion pathway protein A
MYLHHWGLGERPFQNTYNPAYLYRSEGHEEALSRLRYTLEGDRGFAIVTGPTGCGKSFLCRAFAEGAKGVEVCRIANPVDDPHEILQQVKGGLGVMGGAETRADLIRSIEEAALETFQGGRQTLIVIDDAHLLGDPSIPRELRQLLNLEERGRRLVNLILAGQEALEAMIQDSPPLAQRLAMRARVDPLPPEEVGGYVTYRLKVAGRAEDVFEAGAIARIASATGCVPRAINDLCDVALFAAWGEGKQSVGRDEIEAALGDVVPVE